VNITIEQPKKEVKEEEEVSLAQPSTPEEEMLLIISKFSPDIFLKIARMP